MEPDIVTAWKTPPEFWDRLKPLARQMRRDATPSEERLWQRLRNCQVEGLKFRRQHPVGRFIVDFYCAEARLVIEVDGPIHEYTPDDDAVRQEFLESQGLRLLRLSNAEVDASLAKVLGSIAEAAGGLHP